MNRSSKSRNILWYTICSFIHSSRVWWRQSNMRQSVHPRLLLGRQVIHKQRGRRRKHKSNDRTTSASWPVELQQSESVGWVHRWKGLRQTVRVTGGWLHRKSNGCEDSRQVLIVLLRQLYYKMPPKSQKASWVNQTNSGQWVPKTSGLRLI